APEERRFERGCAAARKWIVNGLTGTRQPLDEKAWQLRLETCAIGDFMQAVSGSLAAGPELVDEERHRGGLPLKTGLRNFFQSLLPIPREVAQLANECLCTGLPAD